MKSLEIESSLKKSPVKAKPDQQALMNQGVMKIERDRVIDHLVFLDLLPTERAFIPPITLEPRLALPETWF